MKAIKENKVYSISDTEKSRYLAQGFDITDDNGNIVERSPSSTVSRKEYDELLAKYQALVAEKNQASKAEGTAAKKKG